MTATKMFLRGAPMEISLRNIAINLALAALALVGFQTEARADPVTTGYMSYCSCTSLGYCGGSVQAPVVGKTSEEVTNTCRLWGGHLVSPIIPNVSQTSDIGCSGERPPPKGTAGYQPGDDSVMAFPTNLLNVEVPVGTRATKLFCWIWDGHNSSPCPNATYCPVGTIFTNGVYKKVDPNTGKLQYTWDVNKGGTDQIWLGIGAEYK